MSATTSVHEIELPARLCPETIAVLLRALRGPITGAVVVLRGTDSFCDGLDLGAVRESGGEILHRAVSGFAQILGTLQALPHPLLAVVEGSARGGGVGLAAACDVVLAGPQASFALPEAIFGLTPAIVGPLVAARVGGPTLRRLALTASPIDSHEALHLGLADFTAEADDLQSTTKRLVRALSRTAAAAGPLRARFGPEASDFDAGARETLQRLNDPDVQRRIAAFERGDAPWEATP